MDFKKLSDSGILPVINITDIETALPLAKILVENDIDVLEITLRSDVSLDAISLIKKNYPQIFLSAGTVLTTDTVDKAVSHGADCIVTPGYDEELVSYCMSKNIPIIPGCTTASEIQNGIKHGISVFKYFPAELSGGLKALELLSGPFPKVKFLPTGGMTFDNIESYLRKPYIIACGGSYMAPKELLSAHKYTEISSLCKMAREKSLGFELSHIGINCNGKAEATATAEFIAKTFFTSTVPYEKCTFTSTYVECMNEGKYGKYGHIGFCTNSMPRALAYFDKHGIEINKESYQFDGKGNITCAYLKDEVMGFALHTVIRKK